MRLHRISWIVSLPFRQPVLLVASLLFSGILYVANMQASIYDIQSPKLVITMAVFILLSPLFHGVVILLVRGVERGDAISPWRALSQTAAFYPRLVVGEILVNLVVVAGLFLFILPGIYVGLRFIFYKQAILIDQTAGTAALQTSLRRTPGWRIPLVLILLLAPFYGLVILIGYLVTQYSLGAFGEGLAAAASALTLVWTNALLTSLYLEPTMVPHLMKSTKDDPEV